MNSRRTQTPTIPQLYTFEKQDPQFLFLSPMAMCGDGYGKLLSWMGDYLILFIRRDFKSSFKNQLFLNTTHKVHFHKVQIFEIFRTQHFERKFEMLSESFDRMSVVHVPRSVGRKIESDETSRYIFFFLVKKKCSDTKKSANFVGKSVTAVN